MSKNIETLKNYRSGASFEMKRKSTFKKANYSILEDGTKMGESSYSRICNSIDKHPDEKDPGRLAAYANASPDAVARVMKHREAIRIAATAKNPDSNLNPVIEKGSVVPSQDNQASRVDSEAKRNYRIRGLLLMQRSLPLVKMKPNFFYEMPEMAAKEVRGYFLDEKRNPTHEEPKPKQLTEDEKKLRTIADCFILYSEHKIPLKLISDEIATELCLNRGQLETLFSKLRFVDGEVRKLKEPAKPQQKPV